jgi:molecular chaperone DnaJ
VPFDTALHGGKMTIRFQRDARCSSCNGVGAAPDSPVNRCGQCQGSGSVAMGGGPFTVRRPCPVCRGRGQTIEKPCPTCRGRGAVVKSEEVTVTIPGGISDGQSIRLASLGNVGDNGLPAGDLLLEVQVESKPGFRREGRHVHSDVEVPMVDAALGADLEVETVDGPVTLHVPAGTQPGATFRLREKGFPGGRHGRGDHLVHTRIMVPLQLSPEQTSALEAFRSASDTDNAASEEHSGSVE